MTKRKMSKEEKLKWYKEEFEDINSEIKNKDSLSYLDFLIIRNFKLRISSREKEENIQKITFEAFKLAKKKDKIKEAINKLIKNLNGVGIPIASTILAMKLPDEYAIIDRKVIDELYKESLINKDIYDNWKKDYTKNPKTYEEYLLFMKKTKPQNISLRDFERSLFEK